MKTFLAALAVLVVVAVAIVSIGYFLSQKTDVESTDVTLSDRTDGGAIKIAHVSDLHYPNGFLSLAELNRLLSEQQPDMIVFTGDIADGDATETDIEHLSTLFSASSTLCPSFLVIGNHEIGSKYLDLFLQTAKTNGVTPLLNEIKTLSVRGKSLALIGLSDGYQLAKKTFPLVPKIDTLPKILLSHRPESLADYASAPDALHPDLVFAGHAHGGIARIGSLSLYAPNQGLFPRYTSGLYKQNATSMVVSRGLGNSGTDFRCFNAYHLPIVTVHL